MSGKLTKPSITLKTLIGVALCPAVRTSASDAKPTAIKVVATNKRRSENWMGFRIAAF